MRTIFGLVLIVGIALAGGAVYLVQSFLGQKEQQLAAERALREKIGPMVEVYVVNKQLAYGKPLTKEDVTLMYWPQNKLPEGIFAAKAEKPLFPENNDKQRYVLRQMEAFEPVLAVKVTEPGEDAGLTQRLTKGMRAFAINVDVASGVSGFLQPGDKVDIYWTGNPDRTLGDMTRLIESAIKIVAVDQSADGDRSGSAMIARTVTVEGTPEQVGRLAQAQATGRLALSLVGADDTGVEGLVEVNSRSLLGIEAAQVVPEAAPDRVCTIKTRKGADVVEIPIPCTN
jgi:pilus assembly protein CpaB